MNTSVRTAEEDAAFFKAINDEHFAIFTDQKMAQEERQRRIIAFEQKLHNHLNLNPHHPHFLFALAGFYLNLEKSGIAIALLEKVERTKEFKKDPDPGLYLNMAAAYKIEHNDEMAEHFYMQAAAAARKKNDLRALAHAYHGIGSLYINRGEPKKCIEWCNRALDIEPDDRFALWNKGIACLEDGQWAEGGRLYHEAGFQENKYKAPERKIKEYGGLPEWDGSPGKTIICYGEQGVGDEVMFASMLPDLLRDCKVIIDCDKRLEDLFKRSFPEAVAVYPTSDVNAPFEWVKNHQIDARIAMGSLMHFYRKKAEDFPKVPFIQADPERQRRWRAELSSMVFNGNGKRLNVAISYAGGFKKTRQDQRTIPLDQWESILKVPGVNWFSVQYHNWAPDEAANIGNKIGVPIHHWHDVIGDWNEWAAFLSEIDLLITVNTSVHHLAGSLGLNQWCLTPKYVAWRYGTEGPSPFYGNCSMYRQDKANDWKPVMAKVEADLRAMVNE